MQSPDSDEGSSCLSRRNMICSGAAVVAITQERLRGLKLACFEGATTSKHAPGDARFLAANGQLDFSVSPCKAFARHADLRAWSRLVSRFRSAYP